MASIVRRLEDEFDMEADYGLQALLTQAFDVDSIIRDEINDQYEEGEEYEEGEYIALDVIIVSHIHSKTEEGDFECPICYEEILTNKRVTISCGHDFCMTCTVGLLKMGRQEKINVTCPMCRHPAFLLETPDEPQFKEIGNLLNEVSEMENIVEDDFQAFIHHHFQ